MKTRTCVFLSESSSVVGDAVENLGELTHLPEVVVSLLQSGELSQETLVLSSLLIQLCSQSRTPLRHRLMQTLCTHTRAHADAQ